MVTFSQLYQDFNKSTRLLVAIYLPVLGFLAVIATLCLYTEIPINYLTRDPASITGEAFYLGLLSNSGVLCWCVGATVCFFNYALSRRLQPLGKRRVFWFWSGMLTALFLVDDLFMVHEAILPYYLHIPEKVTFIVYGLLMMLYFGLFYRTIVTGRYWVMVAGLFCWGGAIAGEILFEKGGLYSLVEDGGKLLGIVGWLAYFALFAVQEIEHLVG